MAAIIVIMGPTGAGKTVQAERLAARHGWAHLSTGELLRRDPKEAPVLATGQLVPSVEVERILGAALAKVPEHQTIVLDGFPRELDEAQWLERILAGSSRRLAHVILIEVDQSTSEARLTRRARSDDSPAAQREKWLEYKQMTEPVIEHYRKSDRLVAVDGRGSIDDIADDIEAILT